MITIQDVLYVIDENNNIEVYENDTLIAQYDGKNAIPEELNSRTIYRLRAESYKIIIEI